MNNLGKSINNLVAESKYDYPLLKSGTPEYERLWNKTMDDYESEHPTVSGFGYGHEQWENTDDGVKFFRKSYLGKDSPNLRKDHDIITSKRPLQFVYRSVSPEEFDFINKNGYIKSNQSQNIGYEVDKGLTCYNKHFSGFYLPEDGGYHLKIRTTPDMKYDANDGYIKTPEKVSIDNIVEVNGLPFRR